MLSKKGLFLLTVLFLCKLVLSGQQTDTILRDEIKPITIQAYRFPFKEAKSLDKIHNTYITAGKKNEVIVVSDLPANLAEKNGRQIFAKVPGAFIYDMDGSGNQVNISTRGLDPHRSWEYNVRQNGVMTNSDIYGYPASHYSPPMEAIQKIEIIRGSGSLQYGSQFGGMINYIIKSPDTSRVFSYESQHSAGSFGLLSTFHAIGGRKGKFSYYAYYQKRVSDGFRDNSRSTSDAQYLQLQYEFSNTLQIRAELGRSTYLHQVSGPLTDAMFAENPRQSTRSRNYFNPDIYVPSVTLYWKLSPTSFLQWTTSAVLGTRNSVQFIGFADTRDTINLSTGLYKNRQVDIDQFNSYTSELRWQQQYNLFRSKHTLIAGIRYIHNNLHRRQLGKGTSGTDYDLTLVDPVFGRDINLKTRNVAFFAENLFQLTNKLSITAGVRVEEGISRMGGTIVYLPDDITKKSIIYSFPLFGAGFQYEINAGNRLYGGWSQAYRPVIFADLTPANDLEKTDPNLQNSSGYNLEAGIKGKLGKHITYDLCAFSLYYERRIGNILESVDNQNVYFLRTNVGNSRTNGLEAYVEANLYSGDTWKISVFTATSYMDGRYVSGRLRKGNDNVNLKGNKIESVPAWISRSGIQCGYKFFTAIVQFSHVAESFADPFNTIIPSPNGAVGLVPAYNILDINTAFKIASFLTIKLGVNNVTDARYFTKRPTGYPGSGIWSSDGRNFIATAVLKF